MGDILLKDVYLSNLVSSFVGQSETEICIGWSLQPNRKGVACFMGRCAVR